MPVCTAHACKTNHFAQKPKTLTVPTAHASSVQSTHASPVPHQTLQHVSRSMYSWPPLQQAWPDKCHFEKIPSWTHILTCSPHSQLSAARVCPEHCCLPAVLTGQPDVRRHGLHLPQFEESLQVHHVGKLRLCACAKLASCVMQPQ